MARELPDSSRCTATVERTGHRCNTARVSGTDLCWLHSRTPEQRAENAKTAAAKSARVRSMPPSVRRRRRTAKERTADPTAPSYVPADDVGDVLDTVWPLWRRVEDRPIGFRSRTGDTFAVLGCLWPGETPDAPVFKACERGCKTTCFLMAEQPPERQRVDGLEDEVAQPTTEGEKA
jgi:hypothetical protein